MSLALLHHFWKMARRKDAGHVPSSIAPVSPGGDKFVLLSAEASLSTRRVPWEQGEDGTAMHTSQEKAGTHSWSCQERGMSKPCCALRGQLCKGKALANHGW